MTIRPQIAKLTRPRLARVVERNRLYKRLDRAAPNKIVWISAPAGSGKTMLVASWLDSRKLPRLWYQADEGDADIATFFSYMGKAAKAYSRCRAAQHSGMALETSTRTEEIYARLRQRMRG